MQKHVRKGDWKDTPCELIQAVCVPLVIGNPTSRHRNITDGRVSSTVVAACLLPIFFVLTLVSSLTDNYRSSLLTPRWLILISLYICSVASTIGLSVAIYRNRSQWLKPNPLVDMSQKPKLLFLWFFGISIALNSALNVSANIDCIVIGGHETFPGQQGVSIVIHLVAISFYCGQLGFLSYFVNYKLISSVVLNYCISCMLITHVVGWLNVTISTFFKNDILRPSYNFTQLNETDCYWSTDINKFRMKISAFITPAETEYSLLSVAFILRLWTASGETDSPARGLSAITENREETTDERSPLLSSYQRRCKFVKKQDVKTENQNTAGYSVHVDIEDETDSQQTKSGAIVSLPRLPGDGHEDTAMTECEDDLKGTLPQQDVLAPRPPGNLYVTILLGVLFSMPLLVGVVYAINVNQSYFTTASVLEISRTIFAIIFFISVVITYRLLHKHCQMKQERRVFTGKDYITVLCTAGAVAFMTFVFLAGIQVPSTYYGLVCGLTAFNGVIDCLTIYLQTVLIFYSDHCKKKAHSSCRIEYYFVFLCIINFVLWFADSYTSSHHIKTARVPHQLYGSTYWSMIVEVLFPFTIFYRFHSSMDMYERYRQFLQE